MMKEAESPPEKLYKAEENDEVDQMLGEWINTHGCKTEIKRLGGGFYMFGEKKIFAKILMENSLFRVGDGFMDIDEFMKHDDMMKLAKQATTTIPTAAPLSTIPTAAPVPTSAPASYSTAPASAPVSYPVTSIPTPVPGTSYTHSASSTVTYMMGNAESPAEKLYKADENDKVDQMLGEWISTHGCEIEIERLGGEYYMFGEKICAKIVNGRLMI